MAIIPIITSEYHLKSRCEMEIPKELDDLCYKVIGACIEVHNELGPGFPEEYYQKALELEFTNRQVSYEPQKPVHMLHKGTQIGLNYLDFVIDEKLILEIKSANALNEVHLFQTLKYLAVAKYPLALLVNFGQSKLEKKRVLPTLKMQEFRGRER